MTCRCQGRWTKQEHLAFLRGLRVYGRDWNKIQRLVGTRSQPQVRSHAQKYFQRIAQAKESRRIGETPTTAR
ncbi:myb-like dna-binding shaqkyf class family protein [Nannochloropsis gaditana]|uniref:Myb-like dna-binding shaqkyf class family protein n=1 Tax=Nannochloropsis gaditana TaxID=72520 RepID=W7TGG4_9STRA|nr:myb-like dna-binding shaqkyf class family protein [Nannochloropsis gaditana]